MKYFLFCSLLSVSRCVIWFDFHIQLTLKFSCMPHRNFSWPIQTLIASHSKACLMERSSWTASSRRSWLEAHACHCGGQVQCRPGWRLSWECPCTSEPALKTSKVGRYDLVHVAFCCLFTCVWCCLMLADGHVEVLCLFDRELYFCSLGASRPDGWWFRAGPRYQ